MAVTAEALSERTRRSRSSPLSPHVLAIVVTHNGRGWLKDCLVALNSQTYEQLDVLVVDDASSDFRGPPHLKRVVKRHVRARRWGFVRTPRPLGFGGAINWALGRVRTDADLLLFVHDDAALDKSAVERMVERMLLDDATAIVGPKIVAWDDPARLEEVGMAVDRFGYPYKGIEPGEIDIGQHDVAAEAFFVTSTCMLIRHDVFRELQGWDAAMRAFSEDLDLCWRGRLAGHVVRVEPAARVRHAVALATGRRRSPFASTRYFSRRNRLRAVAKNASALRLVWLLPQFVLLSIVEMLGFALLGQPRQILNLARALGWNVLRLPDTILSRWHIQHRRKMPDRRFKRLTVRESTRVHAYVTHQADRLEQAWGRRAELASARVAQLRAFAGRMRGWRALLACAGAVALALGFRHYIWSPPASVGELLPFPDNATAMWRTFLSPWQAAGLGSPGPASPALAILGIFPVALLGAAGAAQKALVATAGVMAFVGAYRLLSEVVDRGGRWAAGLAYALGGVGYAGVRDGDLGALAFGAAAPFALHSLLRMTGWVRPSRWRAGTEAAKLALAAAVSASFVPGSLLLYGLAAVVLTATRWVLVRGMEIRRGLIAWLGALVGAWLLLLPWSATWWDDGGPLGLLTGGSTWRSYARAFAGHGMVSVLAGQTPRGPVLVGLALPILGLIAVAAGEGQRRRLALALWTLLVAAGWLIGATAAGTLPSVVASATQAGVLPALALAGLAGLATAGARLDLPRRGLGVRHGVVLVGLLGAAVLVAAGIGRTIWQGGWAPGRGAPVAGSRVTERIRLVLGAERLRLGEFRALWVGESWSSPQSHRVTAAGDYVVTGPRGQLMTDLFSRHDGAGVAQLERAIASVRQNATDSGGSLLGAFDIHYVVVDRSGGAARWLAQRDLAVVRSEPSYLLLENQVILARAGVYDEVPPVVKALEQIDPSLHSSAPATLLTVATQKSASSYAAKRASGPGVVFVAEQNDSGWSATVGNTTLEPVSGGWANAFAVPAGVSGDLRIFFAAPSSRYLWFAAMFLAWIVVIRAARRTEVGLPRGMQLPR